MYVIYREVMDDIDKKFMNHYTESSVSILCQITLQKHALYINFNLIVLTSFEVFIMTTMDSQEPPCCYNSHLLGF